MDNNFWNNSLSEEVVDLTDSNSPNITSVRENGSGSLEDDCENLLMQTSYDDEEQWEICYQKLVAYKRKHGHCNVPHDFNEDPSLGRWVQIQRSENRKSKLKFKRFERLDELGLFLSAPSRNYEKWKWELCYLELVDFKERHGHCNIPLKYDENQQLSDWAAYQRMFHFKNKLTPERFQRLKRIGFFLDAFPAVPRINEGKKRYKSNRKREDRWETFYKELADFKQKHGNCKVPVNFNGSPKLARWVASQRSNMRNKKLPREKFDRLVKLGLASSIYSKQGSANSWELRFQQLVAYKEKYGNCNVPLKLKEDPDFGTWVCHQRISGYKEELPQEKFKRLQDLGLFGPQWETLYQELVLYKEKYGDCNVPFEFEENPRLGRWVQCQRDEFYEGKLKYSRFQLLNQLGFTFSTSSEADEDDKRWEAWYQKLIAYKEKYKHCDFSLKLKENQMSSDSVAELTKDRLPHLEEQDFESCPHSKNEHGRNRSVTQHDKPVALRESHDHTDGPENFQGNSIETKKTSKRKKPSADELQFWESPHPRLPACSVTGEIEGRWEMRYQELIAYREKHGHCNVPYNFDENPSLGSWVHIQRKRMRYLQDLGFDFGSRFGMNEYGDPYGLGGVSSEKGSHLDFKMTSPQDHTNEMMGCNPRLCSDLLTEKESKDLNSALGRWLGHDYEGNQISSSANNGMLENRSSLSELICHKGILECADDNDNPLGDFEL